MPRWPTSSQIRMIKKKSFVNGLTFWTVFAIFSCALVVGKLVNICFYLLLVIAIVELIAEPNARNDFWLTCKKYWPINLGMCSALIAILLRQLSQAEFTVRLYDLPARFALFALLFWLLLKLPSEWLKKIKWSFVCGAIIYTVTVYIDTKDAGMRVDNINSFSIIFSSELALLMAVFSILSIAWVDPTQLGARQILPRRTLTLALLIVAGVCGLFSVYLSQTRGAWIAIPFFVFIAVSTLMHQQKTRTKIFTYVAIVVTLIVLSSATDIVKDRIIDAQQNITEFTLKTNLDTSVGVRFQLWNASWIMFKEHPIFGVGKENFSDELHTLKDRGIITEAAAKQYHSHDEILYGMSTLGIFGLLATLITYLVPGYYFGKNMFHSNGQIHAAAAMGLSLCIGYFIFGLVDVMFGWNMCNVFYTISIAVLLAFIVNKNNELATSPKH